MSECKDNGQCGLGGYCDDCYQVVIAEKDERIDEVEVEIDRLESSGVNSDYVRYAVAEFIAAKE